MECSNKQIYKPGDMIVFALNSNPTEENLYPGKGARGEVREIHMSERPMVNNTRVTWKDGRMKGQSWWYPAERLRHMSIGGF